MAVDPKDQAELNNLYEEYIRLLQVANGYEESIARKKADNAKLTGTLLDEINRINKSLLETTFLSDSLSRGFQDALAELKGYNNNLKAGSLLFKNLANTASELAYAQKGISDLDEKQFRKKEASIQKSKEEVNFLLKRLGVQKGIGDQAVIEYNRQRELSNLESLKTTLAEGFTKQQEKLLQTLQKEKALLNEISDIDQNSIPALERELQLSKQIYTTREDIGGLAGAIAKVIDKYGGSLSRFLNVSEAIESVKKYNQNLIEGAITSEKVQEKLKKIEDDRIKILTGEGQLQDKVLKASKELQTAEAQIGKEVDLRNQKLKLEEQLKNATGQDSLKILRDLSGVSEKIAKIDELKTNLVKQQKDLSDELLALEKEELNTKIDAIKSTDRFINKIKALGVVTAELARGFIKAFKDPLTYLTFLIKTINFFIDRAILASEQVAEISRSLGVGAQEANRLRESFIRYANTVNDTFLTQDKLVKSQIELSKELNTTVEFREQELEAFSRLTELSGLANNEAAKLVKLSIINGGQLNTNTNVAEKYADSIRVAAFFASEENQLHVTGREIMKTIEKTSAGILIKFKGNVTALTNTVVEAKKLGLTLDQIDKIGESLLNFEQSIENELKAELLTGRQINLERARYAALTGNQLALTREITSQVGDLADYQNMNIIAQKALAEAFGFTRAEMSEMLIEQDFNRKYNAQNLKTTKAQREEFEQMKKVIPGLTLEKFLRDNERSLGVQVRFNQAMERLKTLISGIVEGPIFKALEKIVGGLEAAVKLAGTLGNKLKSILGDESFNVLKQSASVAAVGALIIGVGLLAKATFANLTKGLTPFTAMWVRVVGLTPGGFGMGGGTNTTGATTSRPTTPTPFTGQIKPTTPNIPNSPMRPVAPVIPPGGAGLTLPPPPATTMSGGFIPKPTQIVQPPGIPTTPAAITAGIAPKPVSVPPPPPPPPPVPPGASAAGVGAPTTGGGFFGKVGGFFKQFSPKNILASLKGVSISSLLKNATKIGIFTGIFESLFAANDVQAILASGAPQKEIDQAIGKRVLQGIGGVLTGSVVTALVGLTGVGFLASALTYMGGDFVGRILAGWLADAGLAEPTGEFIRTKFGLSSKTPETPQTEALADGGTVIKEGLAQVDKGEVYLGKNTREILQILASNSISQTRALNQVSAGFASIAEFNNIIGKLNFTSFNDAVNKLINYKPTNDISSLADTIANKINFTPLTEAINRLSTTSTNIEQPTPVPIPPPTTNVIKETTYVTQTTNNIDVAPITAAINDLKSAVSNTVNRPLNVTVLLDGKQIAAQIFTESKLV